LFNLCWKKCGCHVIGMNIEPTGIFAHKPEPIPENLSDLCNRVLMEKADFGIAVDPDVDRCVLIDSNGKPLGEEYTLALAIKFYLQYVQKTSVVKNLSSSRAIDDICESYSTKCLATPVGEINVAKKMVEIGSLIGGEGNGGVMLTEVHVGRDAVVAVALTLQHLTSFGGSLQDLKSTLPQYEIVKLKAPITGIDQNEVVSHFKKEYKSKDGISLNEEDGLHISSSNPKWWVHLRKSNTEPIIRVIGEAEGGKSESEIICKKFLDSIVAMKK